MYFQALSQLFNVSVGNSEKLGKALGTRLGLLALISSEYYFHTKCES